MNSNDTILETIDPEVADRLIKSSDEIAQGRSTSSWVTAALAMSSVPIAHAALSKDAFGQTAGTVQDVLNFAIMLEIFEDEFYRAVLGKSLIAAQNAAFATVRAKVPAAAATSIAKISQHETSHVATLKAAGAVNVLNLDGTSFDFTGARGAGNGPFLAATTDLNFLLLMAQAAEDTGVRAYKGQAGNLMSNPTRSRPHCASILWKRVTPRRSAAFVVKPARRSRCVIAAPYLALGPRPPEQTTCRIRPPVQSPHWA